MNTTSHEITPKSSTSSGLPSRRSFLKQILTNHPSTVMKRRLLVLALCIGLLAVAGALWDKTQLANDHAAAADHAAIREGQKPQPLPVAQPIPTAVHEQFSGLKLLQSDKVWIEAHLAPVGIKQTRDPTTGFLIGTIEMAGFVGDLGETPPLYSFAIKSRKYPLLVGADDERNHFRRRLETVRVDGQRVVRDAALDVSYPRFPGVSVFGGFVFPSDEAAVRRVGVILPEITVPNGENTSDNQWQTEIRLHERMLGAETQAKIQSQPLTPNLVMLLKTDAPPPSSARILWFNIADDGCLVLEEK